MNKYRAPSREIVEIVENSEKQVRVLFNDSFLFYLGILTTYQTIAVEG